MGKRPVYLFSMDSDQFHAAPLTTAGLQAYHQFYSEHQACTRFELVHFKDAMAVDQWQEDSGLNDLLADAAVALSQDITPVFGFSVYTWNAAEFLHLCTVLNAQCPQALIVAGGPHVQEAKDYLLDEAIDLIVLGEGEATFSELLDQLAVCEKNNTVVTSLNWQAVAGLAWREGEEVARGEERPRERNLDRLPSALEFLPLRDESGQPLYDSISYETSRGCPFKCAFCEWGTGAIGTKMNQFSMARI